MGNVHPYPRYLPREPSLHGHPAPLKKYGLLSTHLGCKSAIKGTVHLLLCHARMLIPGRFLQPHPGQKHPFTRELHLPSQLCSCVLPLLRANGHMEGTDLSLVFGWMSCSPLPAQPVPPSLILTFLVLPLRFDSLLPSGRAIFTLDLKGYLFYVTLCD